MYQRPDFDKLIGRETLPNVDQVMKHVGWSRCPSGK